MELKFLKLEFYRSIWRTKMKMKTIWRTEEPVLKKEEERSRKHRSKEEKQRFGECRTIWKIEGKSEGAELKNRGGRICRSRRGRRRGGTRVLCGFHMNNFCLPAQELKHLRLEFYHETWVLKTQDAIFHIVLQTSPLKKLLKNFRVRLVEGVEKLEDGKLWEDGKVEG